MSKKDLKKELSEKANEHSARSPKTDGETKMLRFICPRCGSRDLRTLQLVAYYPASTLEGIEVDSETLEFQELHQREDPFEWIGSNHNNGWEFWCNVCHLVPNLEEYDEVIAQEDQLVRWLVDNCPQDDGLPVTETGQPKEYPLVVFTPALVTLHRGRLIAEVERGPENDKTALSVLWNLTTRIVQRMASRVRWHNAKEGERCLITTSKSGLPLNTWRSNFPTKNP